MSAPAPDAAPAAAATPAAEPAAAPAAAASSSSAPDMSKYGTHECTCDGCNTRPMMGFRYKCTKCPDHDICEACYLKFQKGSLPHTNKQNPVSKDVAAHAFAPYADSKGFSAMGGAAKTQPKTSAGKQKPNEECACGSKKKFKKCCGDPAKK